MLETILSHLKAHFHGPGSDDTVVTPDDCFAKFNQKISTWTPPKGEFSAIGQYIDRCRRSVGALNFEARTSYNNLPQVEKEALKNLLKRDDIVIKYAYKGGAGSQTSYIYFYLFE